MTIVQESKDNWIKALRDGTYRQGAGALREKGKAGRGDQFCCLGVILDLLVPERWKDPDRIKEGNNVSITYIDEEGNDDYNEGELEGDLYDIVGISGQETSHLITLNDGERWHPPSKKYHPPPGVTPRVHPERSETHPEFVKGKEPQGFGVIADWIEANL